MENKKKISGLAKAIWITAAVTVVSAIVAVCFAVSFGSAALKELTDNRHDSKKTIVYNSKELDKLADIEDYSELISSEIHTIPVIGNSVIIKSQIAKIKVISSDSDDIKTEFNQYSNNKDAASLFSLSIDGQTFKINCNEDTNVIPVLIISVPKDTVNNITIENEAGDIDVNGISVFNLKITNSTGKISIENTTSNDADIKNYTGEIELAKSFRCIYKMDVSGKFGNIDFELPQDINFKLQYSVSLGEADLSEVDMEKYNIVSRANIAKTNGTLECKEKDGEQANYNMTMSVGRIELSSETDF